MPRRIILHPGFHKTGTTTLQNTLRRNRAALKPHMRIVLGGQFRDLQHAARGYSTLRDVDTLAKTEVRFAELMQRQPRMPRRTLLLSSEELSGHLPGRPGIPDYSAAVDLACSYVRILRAVFPKSELRLFYTLRDAASWIDSAYWQHVKSSNMTMDIGEFRDRFASAGNLAAIVDRIGDRTGIPIVTAPMDAWQDGPLGPLSPLLGQCGVPEAEITALTPAPPTNTRPDAEVMLELLRINRAYADPEARRLRKAAVLAAQGEDQRDG